MFNNSSYNLPNPSISRLDELLNRNELIYQNLKQKLQGINRSSEVIYRNIEHLNSSFNQQQSSNIQRQFIRQIPIASRDTKFITPTHRQASYNIFNSISNDQLQTISDKHQITFRQNTNHNIDHYNMIFEERIMKERHKNKQMKMRQQQIRREHSALMMRQNDEQIIKHYKKQNESLRSSMKDDDRFMQSLREETKLKQLEMMLEYEQIIELQRLATLTTQAAKHVAQLQSQTRVSQMKGSGILQQKNFNKHAYGIEATNYHVSSSQKQPKMAKSNCVYLNNMAKGVLAQSNQIKEILTFRRLVTQEQQGEPGIHPDIISQPNQIILIKTPEKSYKHRQTQRQLINISQGKYYKQHLKEIAKFNTDYDLNHVMTNTLKNWKYNSNIITSQQIESIYVDRQQQSQRKQLQSISKSLQQQNADKLNNQLEYNISLNYIFIPFNKLYRSPIMQVKASNTIFLERKSKTSSMSINNNRIVDGIKYKCKNIITDQQLLLKYLFYDAKEVGIQHLIEHPVAYKGKIAKINKVAIVGGRDSLKKKIHMGLLAYVYQYLLHQINKNKNCMICNFEHQQINPYTNTNQFQLSITIQPTQRKVAFMKLEKAIEQIYHMIRKGSAPQITTCSTNTVSASRKILRMTKISFYSQQKLHFNMDIISSNRYDYSFLGSLKIEKIVWCINPLIKNYEEVKQTLDCMKNYIAMKKIY